MQVQAFSLLAVAQQWHAEKQPTTDECQQKQDNKFEGGAYQQAKEMVRKEGEQGWLVVTRGMDRMECKLTSCTIFEKTIEMEF